MSWLALILLTCVATQRVGELFMDKRNTQALKEAGAVEYGANHYPLFILLHGSWLLSLMVWTVMTDPQINWALLGLYILLQGARVWVLKSLGQFWTTRIISLPDAPLVVSGPYRYLRHPNYWIVVCEIALLPAVLGAWPIMVAYSILNGALLVHRIRVENAALLLRR